MLNPEILFISFKNLSRIHVPQRYDNMHQPQILMLSQLNVLKISVHHVYL